jgi:transcription antitermination factor NusG
MSFAWYVLYSKPNKEEFLRQQLIHKHVEHFYPCVAVTPVNPRSRKIRPYFPGYLFVNLDLDEINQSPSLQWMPGAVGLVSFDGRAAEVPVGLIIALKQRLGEEAILRKDEHTFKAGDHIQVLSGPFEGYDGIFDIRLSGSERVRILIELLRGYATKVDLPAKSIKKTTHL